MTKIVEDSFTEGSNTNLDAHTPDVGTGWTLEFDDTSPTQTLVVFASVDQLAASADQADTGLFYSSQPNPTVTEYDVSIVFVNGDGGAGDQAGLVGRYTDSDNWYCAGISRPASATDSRIYKRVTSTTTLIASGDLGGSSGAFDGDQWIFKLRDSTSRQVWRDETDGVEITADDTALTAAGKVGIFGGDLHQGVGWDLENIYALDTYYWDDLLVVGGQPTQLRTQGIPTGSGSRDRPGRWN